MNEIELAVDVTIEPAATSVVPPVRDAILAGTFIGNRDAVLADAVAGFLAGEAGDAITHWFGAERGARLRIDPQALRDAVDRDIATIDAHGVLQIRDRAKDLIKSGGEWISSLDLENAACGHPAVAAAAVIGVKHPQWQERPLLFVVRRPGQELEREHILEYLATKVARWWVPDEVIFLDSLPVGGTGKVQKTILREKYGNVFD